MNVDKNGNNALMILINQNMEYEAISLIYGLETIAINEYLSSVNNNGDTPLLLACKHNMKNLSELICSDSFIDYCIDKINSDNETALMWACFFNLTNVVDVLIRNKLSPFDLINNFGHTCLIICCSNSMVTEAIMLLKTNQSNPAHVSNNNKTALMWACCKNLIEVVKELLKHDCNLTHSYNEITALNLSFKMKHYEIVELLLSHQMTLITREKIETIIEIITKFKNKFNFSGIIKEKHLITLLNNTDYEYLTDTNELVNYKIGIHECIICTNLCETSYCFNKCNHVIYYHSNCINSTIECPICRTPSNFFKCYVAN